MEFSSEALCREKQGGGIMQTCTRWTRMAQTSALPPQTDLCQGFSTAIPRLVAIPRAQDVSDDVVTSHVMAGVIQPPVWSVKEWNPFIPSPPALPRQCPTQTRVLRAGDGIARLRIAFTQLGF